MFALIEQFHFLEIFERFSQRILRRFQLALHVIGRRQQVVPALQSRLGKGGIGEMGDIGNAGLGMLDLDLLVEFGRHALEIGNHHLDLRDLTALFVHLELLEPNEALAARFQDLYSLHIKSVLGGPS